MTTKNRAVFLDRDGVINQVIIREGKVYSPRTIQEFSWEDGIIEGIEKLKRNGFLLIVVTNQPDIARGKMAPSVLNSMTTMIYETLPIDDVLVCPHDDADRCLCRKPKAGMLLEAGKKWNVDCRRSFIIGDNWKDMRAGEAAGCTTILLDRFYNQKVSCDYRVRDLEEAVGIISDTKSWLLENVRKLPESDIQD